MKPYTNFPSTPFVFISYSRKDSTFVNRLIADLKSRGIAVWIDTEGLKPGTPDWEAAIREAIRRCEAVVLIASPDSRASPYVRDELALADDGKKPILPIWAAGDSWVDSVPLGMGSFQHLDMRATKYSSDSVVKLVNSLPNSITKTVKPSTSPFGSSSSPFGSIRPSTPPAPPPSQGTYYEDDDDYDDEDDEDFPPRTSNPFSSRPGTSSGSNPFRPTTPGGGGTSEQPAAKPSSPFNRPFGSPVPGARETSERPAEKPASPFGSTRPSEKKDEKPVSGGLGGLTGRPFGGSSSGLGGSGSSAKPGSASPFGATKPGDKKDDKPVSGKPISGGLSGRLPFGSGSSGSGGGLSSNPFGDTKSSGQTSEKKAVPLPGGRPSGVPRPRAVPPPSANARPIKMASPRTQQSRAAWFGAVAIFGLIFFFVLRNNGAFSGASATATPNAAQWYDNMTPTTDNLELVMTDTTLILRVTGVVPPRLGGLRLGVITPSGTINRPIEPDFSVLQTDVQPPLDGCFIYHQSTMPLGSNQCGAVFPFAVGDTASEGRFWVDGLGRLMSVYVLQADGSVMKVCEPVIGQRCAIRYAP